MSVLITGGAGFVGSSLACWLRERSPGRRIVAFDNLKRRGSELNVPTLQQRGIEFCHGDIRVPEDLQALGGTFDLLVEASAEPSVHAGMDGSPAYLLQTNLTGTLNCLEFARQGCGGTIFLSTSRVYSIPALRALPLAEQATRLVPDGQAPGFSARGISEAFTTTGFRSLYGATKLASELVAEEYHALYGMPVLTNRCGVIAGPGQWGKVDQGVYTLWVAHHYFGRPLRYMGFGGAGKQVRDLLHPEDLAALVAEQEGCLSAHAGKVFNVGGGPERSTSLLEYTQLCQQVTGRAVEVGSVPETNLVDVPYYVSDCARLEQAFAWRPQRDVRQIVTDIHAWLRREEPRLRGVFT